LSHNPLRVLVTGSSRGIGLAIAKAFLFEGNHVAINGRDENLLNILARENDKFYPVNGDVSYPEEAIDIVSRSVALMGGLDVIVCNVGSGVSVKPGDENFDEWQRIFGLNFFSATNIIEAGIGHLNKDQGNIICISSICGCEVIPGAPLTYSVAKAALNSYVKGMSRYLGNIGIRINAIAPGNIVFDGSIWDRKLTENKSEVQSILENDVPLKRLGSTSEIASTVLWLASKQASFVTGSILVADGGQTRSV
jgi:3-oxoacyl-[acyl-carrier protein] reductase